MTIARSMIDAAVRCVKCGERPPCRCWVRLRCEICDASTLVDRTPDDGNVKEVATRCPHCASVERDLTTAQRIALAEADDGGYLAQGSGRRATAKRLRELGLVELRDPPGWLAGVYVEITEKGRALLYGMRPKDEPTGAAREPAGDPQSPGDGTVDASQASASTVQGGASRRRR